MHSETTQTHMKKVKFYNCESGHSYAATRKIWILKRFLRHLSTKKAHVTLNSHIKHCPQITSWSQQGMRLLRQCTVPWAEVMFVSIQRENIRHPNKKWTRLLQYLNSPMFAVMLWITVSLSLANRKSSVHLHALYPPHCTKDVYTPQGSTRDLRTVVHPTTSCNKHLPHSASVTAVLT
jgi:hypothetical protein